MAPGGYLTAPPGSQGLIPGAFMVPGVPVSQFNQQSAMHVIFFYYFGLLCVVLLNKFACQKRRNNRLIFITIHNFP